MTSVPSIHVTILFHITGLENGMTVQMVMLHYLQTMGMKQPTRNGRQQPQSLLYISENLGELKTSINLLVKILLFTDMCRQKIQDHNFMLIKKKKDIDIT